VFDAAIFIFDRNTRPITVFTQFRGKRLSIGVPGSALRALMLEVLKTAGGLDASTQILLLDNAESINALTRGEVDVAVVPQLDGNPFQHVHGTSEIRLMSVAQAEAIAKAVPGQNMWSYGEV
jgi:TRAP-type uncharacterized transport system substrate-binding protein